MLRRRSANSTCPPPHAAWRSTARVVPEDGAPPVYVVTFSSEEAACGDYTPVSSDDPPDASTDRTWHPSLRAAGVSPLVPDQTPPHPVSTPATVVSRAEWHRRLTSPSDNPGGVFFPAIGEEGPSDARGVKKRAADYWDVVSRHAEASVDAALEAVDRGDALLDAAGNYQRAVAALRMAADISSRRQQSLARDVA